MSKFYMKDIEKAIEHLKKKYGVDEVRMELDGSHRLLITAYSIDGDLIKITLYATEAGKMPDITLTQRL